MSAFSFRNLDADNHNCGELCKLSAEEVVIAADDHIVTKEENDDSETFDQQMHAKQFAHLKAADFWRDCLALKQINLKVGAQVSMTFEFWKHGPLLVMFGNSYHVIGV